MEKYNIKIIQRIEDLFGCIKFIPHNEIWDKLILDENNNYLYINKEHCEPLQRIEIYIDENEHFVDKDGKKLIKYNDLKKYVGKIYVESFADE